MTDKALEQEAAERYPITQNDANHFLFQTSLRKAYIAGRTASSNEEGEPKHSDKCECSMCMTRRHYDAKEVSEGQGEKKKGLTLEQENFYKDFTDYLYNDTHWKHRFDEAQRISILAPLLTFLSGQESQLSEGTAPKHNPDPNTHTTETKGFNTDKFEI